MNVPKGFRFAGGRPVSSRCAATSRSSSPTYPRSPPARFTNEPGGGGADLDARPRVPATAMRAVVVNSGNANALTGAAGLADVVAIRTAFAQALGDPARRRSSPRRPA